MVCVGCFIDRYFFFKNRRWERLTLDLEDVLMMEAGSE